MMHTYRQLMGVVLCALYLALPTAATALVITTPVVTDNPLNNSGCTVPATRTTFAPTDPQVFFWVGATGISIGDVLQWNWIAPNQSVYASASAGNHQVTFSFSGDGCAWDSIGISGEAAASLLGTWTVNVLLNGSSATSGTFTIGTPPSSGHVPIISFNPPSNSPITAGQIFDFNIIVDFGSTLQFTGGTISLDGTDLTAPFFAALNAGFIHLSINGNVATATVPGQSLPAGQHLVHVTVSNTTGTGTADWTANVTGSSPPGGGPPHFTLSEEQQVLINKNGNPQYLAISFNTNPLRREESWTYVNLNKMYTFWDGVRVQETDVPASPGIYTNPPALDPSAFDKTTTLANLTQLFGAPSGTLDQSKGAFAFTTYYFSTRGLVASFRGSTLTVIQTIDLPTP